MIVFNNKIPMNKALLLLLAITLIFSSKAFSQRTTAVSGERGMPFNLPKNIPVPEWVKQTDWQHPNLLQIDSLIAAYEHEKKEEEQREKGRENSREEQRENANEEGEFDEDPYITAYIRWRSLMEPFMQADGSIIYDPNYHRQQLLNSIENQGKPATGYSPRRTTHRAYAPAPAPNWTLLGPVQTYKPGSAALKNWQSNMYCIAIAPSNPNVLYAGSETGTLYRSDDKGQHWVSVSDSLYSCQPHSIAIDPANENIVYVYDGRTNVLLKSINGGGHWTALSTFTYGSGNAAIINPVTGRISISGTTGIYYSDNAGSTWTLAVGSSVTGSIYDMVQNPVGRDTIFAVGTASTHRIILLRSTDGGSSYSNVTGAIVDTMTSGARLGVTIANTNTVYCVSLGYSTSPCVIKSSDGGATFAVSVTSTATGLIGTSTSVGLGMSNGQGYYDLAIVVSPQDSNQLIVGTTSAFKSVDGGINFSPVGGYMGPFSLHPDMQCAVTLGGDTYITTDGGVNYSSDFFTSQANWSVRDYGIRSADFWGMGQGWDEDLVVGGRYHNGNAGLLDLYGSGNALSLGGGEDATGHVFQGHSRAAGFRDIGTLIIPASMTGNVQNPNAEIPNTLWPQDDYYGKFSSKLMVDPRYSNIFYVGVDSFLYKSTNCGATYTPLHNFGNNNKVWRYDIVRSKPSVIYLCATNGLYKTTNAGAAWSLLTLPVGWSYYNTDVVANPLNENEVYVCMANAGAANKVFRSLNGGASWTNITGTALNNKKVSFLQFQGGTNGGVYALTNVVPSRIYYRDAAMSDWVDYSSGLPGMIGAGPGAIIFYRDSKIRIGSNSSIWESPLYTRGTPVAQPMADRRYLSCARDTIYFFDYSMYDYAGATVSWSFPGASWVSSTSSRKPKVIYPGPGAYSVSLTITDALSQTNTQTIDSMIIISDNVCNADTVAGKCLQLNGTNQTVTLGNVNINSNNFSISCWVQPKGLQSAFSQIVSHDVYPGSGGNGFSFGYTFSGYTPNLKLCYTDSLVSYHSTSTLICDSTKWNFVVLCYSPTGVKIYLNGIPYVLNSTNPMPVIDLSQSPFVLNLDSHEGQGSKFKGKIDEVKFYNYALSQAEVREKMHLITDPSTETGLLKYFQFNQFDTSTGTLFDVVTGFNASVPAANIVASTAPVSTGRVFRNPSVAASGLNSFPAANVNLYLHPGSTYPNGEVVAFHLFSNPDVKADASPAVNGYFILNNYGTNATFTVPDSVVFSGLSISNPAYLPSDFRLFKRASGAFGNTWIGLDSASVYKYTATGSSLTYPSGSNITGFNSQYLVERVSNAVTTSTVTGTSGFCVGATTSLSDGVPGGAWSSTNIFIASVNSVGLVTAVAAGTATISHTLSGGILVSTSVVTVNANPSGIGSATSVCTGASITVSDFVAGGAWTSTANVSIAATGTSTGLVTGITPGTSMITYTLPSGCYRTFPINVNITPLPISGTLSVCTGSVTFLSDATTPGASWNSSTPAVATITASGGVTGVSPGTTTIKYTTAGVCTVNALVTVNPTPVVTAILGPTSVSRGGSGIMLSDLTAGGLWSSSNTAILNVGSTTGLVTAVVSAGSANINYIVINNFGCRGYATKVLSTSPAPPHSGGSFATTVGASINIDDHLSAGEWTSSNTGIATVEPDGTVIGITPGIVNITHTTLGSDGDLLAVVTTVIVSSLQADLKVIPNPNSGEFTIKAAIPATKDQPVTIFVTNLLGEIVYQKNITPIDGNISETIRLAGNLANGTYLLIIKGRDQNMVSHFVVEH